MIRGSVRKIGWVVATASILLSACGGKDTGTEPLIEFRKSKIKRKVRFRCGVSGLAEEQAFRATQLKGKKCYGQ